MPRTVPATEYVPIPVPAPVARGSRSRAKRLYVSLVHALGNLTATQRFLAFCSVPEKQSWIRSLFAVYDLERMIALDVPWWNIRATRAVERFLANRPDARVFEWGSGSSSFWLAARAASVVSVEHDNAWHQQLVACAQAMDGLDLRHVPLVSPGQGDDRYVSAINDDGLLYDLIVIDGRKRSDCLRAALGRLAPGGLILFDNALRARYRAAIRQSALVERRCVGATYCIPYPDTTSILTRPSDVTA